MAVSSMTTSAAAVEAKQFELVSLEKRRFWFGLKHFSDSVTLPVMSLIKQVDEDMARDCWKFEYLGLRLLRKGSGADCGPEVMAPAAFEWRCSPSSEDWRPPPFRRTFSTGRVAASAFRVSLLTLSCCLV